MSVNLTGIAPQIQLVANLRNERRELKGQLPGSSPEATLDLNSRIAALDGQIRAVRTTYTPPVLPIPRTEARWSSHVDLLGRNRVPPPPPPLPQQRGTDPNSNNVPPPHPPQSQSSTGSLPPAGIHITIDPPPPPPPPTAKQRAAGYAWTAAGHIPLPYVPIPEPVRLGTSIAVLAALYHWAPVHAVVNGLLLPSARMLGQGLGFVGIEVPRPLQAVGTYCVYEWMKGVLAGCLKVDPETLDLKIDTKKALAYGTLAAYLLQDEGFRQGAWIALTPTIMSTAAICAAIDYSEYVSESERYIPEVVIKTAQRGAEKLDKVATLSVDGLQYIHQKVVNRNETVEEVKSSVLKGIESSVDYADKATALGTMATVAAYVAGFPTLASSLAFATAIPAGMLVGTHQKV